MATPRRLRFLYAQIGLMLAILLVIDVVGTFSLELFFALSFVAFFLLVQVTEPTAVTPRWRQRVYLFLAFGFIGVFALIIRAALQYVPPGVF